MIKYRHNMKQKLHLFLLKKQAFKYVYACILDVKNESWEV